MNKILLSPLFLVISSLLATTALSTALADNLPRINVTATRTAQTADQSLASVTVITQQQIKQSSASNLAELLTHRAGISVSRSGGSDHLAAIRIRGSESRHVLILVDGIRIGSVATGSAQLQLINLNQIERIEIVRGSRSSLYGSEALGGVIQVFTHKGRQKTQASLSFGIGSHDRRQTRMSLSGQSGNLFYAVGLEHDQSDGYDICNNDSGTIFAACFANEPDKDGHEHLAGNIKLDYAFNDDTRLSTTYNRTKSHLDFDGSVFASNSSAGYIETIGMTLQTTVSDYWDMSLTAGRSRDASDFFYNGVSTGFFDTTRTHYSVQNNVYLNDDHSMTFGIDYIDDSLSSHNTYTSTERFNMGYFVQYQGNFNQIDLSASLRHDQNEQFGGENTGSIALGTDLTENMRVFTAYATAFNAPTFNFLYFPPSFGFTTSNPNLLPETSKNMELGFSGYWGNAQWSASLFHQRINNLIGNDAAFVPDNIAQAVIKGLELTLSTRLNDWNIQTDVTLLDPKIISDTTTPTNNGHVLARRAKRSLQVSAERDFGLWALGATVKYQSDSFDRNVNTRRLDGFTLFNATASYQVNKNWSVTGQVHNLFDKRYETEFYYPQDGRTFMLTAQWEMD